jgi:hypothetical protein
MNKSKFNNKKEWRKFGIGLGVLLGAIATVQLLKGHSVYPYFYGTAAAFLLAGAAAPILVKPLFILFSYLGAVLGWFSTRLILIVVFYALLTPISLVLRLSGKKFMPMGYDRKLLSYWIDRNKTYEQPESFENQF